MASQPAKRHGPKTRQRPYKTKQDIIIQNISKQYKKELKNWLMFLREKCRFSPYKCYDLIGHSIMWMEVVIWYNQVSNQKFK